MRRNNLIMASISLCIPLLNPVLHIVFTDSYTTNDIIFEWNATNVHVGTKEMAQFEYEGVKLSSATDVFTTGKMLLYVFA